LFLSLQHLPQIGGGKFGRSGVSEAAVRPIWHGVSRLQKRYGKNFARTGCVAGPVGILPENLLRLKTFLSLWT
jgi:hypothetical protein